MSLAPVCLSVCPCLPDCQLFSFSLCRKSDPSVHKSRPSVWPMSDISESQISSCFLSPHRICSVCMSLVSRPHRGKSIGKWSENNRLFTPALDPNIPRFAYSPAKFRGCTLAPFPEQPQRDLGLTRWSWKSLGDLWHVSILPSDGWFLGV